MGKHCYTQRWANRLGLDLWSKQAARRFFGDQRWLFTLSVPKATPSIARKLFAVTALSLSILAAADTITGEVIGITDGDTITVIDPDFKKFKIRLAGIDAPEKKQAFGKVARQHLADLLFRKPVSVEVHKLDRYARSVGTVYVAGEDINRRQIQAGLAWHYKKYAHEQPEDEREVYAAAEEEARQSRRGLWRDPEPIPPWQFRETNAPQR